MNIVRFGDYDKQSGGAVPPGTPVPLTEVRDILGERLKRALAAMFDKVDDTLFDMSDRSDSSTDQNGYFDAMRELRLSRAGIEADFRDHFLNGYNRELRRTTPRASTGNDAGELSLMQDDELEESLAISNMVSKLVNQSADDLYLLDRRLGLLMSTPDLEANANPLRPEVICNAFRTACKRIESGVRVKLIVFKLFDKVISEELPEAYTALNEYLVNRNILPELRVTVSKQRAYGKAAQRQRGAGMSGANDNDLLQVLQQLVDSNQAAAGSADTAAINVDAGVLQTLTRLQLGAAKTGMQTGVPIDTEVLMSGTENVIRQLQVTHFNGAMGQVDQMTIDIVAMLFDYILDDRNIPAAIKGLIGRLQIPILKVALIDKGLFSKKGHPARRLLNALAEASLGWNEGRGQDDRLYKAIEAVVQRILYEFDNDVDLFEQVLDGFEEFMQDEDRKANERAERSAQVVQGGERLAHSKARSQAEVKQRADRDGVPDLIREFLNSHWKDLLLVAHYKSGEDSQEWQDALDCMDQLLWTVAPKRDDADKARLHAIKPGLLGRLIKGMDTIAMDPTYRDRFLDKLAALHETASRGEGSPIATAPAPVESAPPAVEAEAPLQAIDGDMPMLTEVYAEGASLDGLLADHSQALVASLQKGSWVEFVAADGAVTRAKLTWISPITGTYLFTNRQGLKAADKSPAVLAEELRKGSLRIIDDAPLLDRAVNTVLDGLKQAGNG